MDDYGILLDLDGTLVDSVFHHVVAWDDTSDSDDVASSKPSPELLLAGCAELAVEPTSAAIVGDSPWDAVAAARVGMRAVAVRTGGFGDDRLFGGGADEVVDDPGELIGRL